MKRVFLDFRFFGSAAEIHRSIARQLDLPDYYGHNLDALHDCLTEPRGEVEFYVMTCGSVYEDGFLAVLRDSAAENRNLKLFIARSDGEA